VKTLKRCCEILLGQLERGDKSRHFALLRTRGQRSRVPLLEQRSIDGRVFPPYHRDINCRDRSIGTRISGQTAVHSRQLLRVAPDCAIITRKILPRRDAESGVDARQQCRRTQATQQGRFNAASWETSLLDGMFLAGSSERRQGTIKVWFAL
jgi:hypothetical protein